MKRIVTSLSFAAALFAIPSAALANHDAPPPPPSVDVGVSPDGFHMHVHNDGCHHDRDDRYEERTDRDGRVEYRRARYDHHRERIVRYPGGYYELRTLDVWVAGQRVEEYVPGECRERGRSGKVKCRPGYTVSHWVPGHYEPREQWVWVDTSPRPRGYYAAGYWR